MGRSGCLGKGFDPPRPHHHPLGDYHLWSGSGLWRSLQRPHFWSWLQGIACIHSLREFELFLVLVVRLLHILSIISSFWTGYGLWSVEVALLACIGMDTLGRGIRRQAG